MPSTTSSATDDSQRFLIIGLGNSGSNYDNTPHNMGYIVVDHFATSTGAQWIREPEGAVAKVELAGSIVHLFKPGGRINNSGNQIRNFLERKGFTSNACVIIHDELDLNLGDVRVKSRGTGAGHNGVTSIISALGTDEFFRIRIGAKRSSAKPNDSRTVLDHFSESDQDGLRLGIERSVVAVQEIVAARK